jgi:predicted RNase H-like HicB family nuclease
VRLTIEIDQEDDGRWLAEVAELPGVLAYGSTSEEALASVTKLARCVIAERIQHGEAVGS